MSMGITERSPMDDRYWKYGPDPHDSMRTEDIRTTLTFIKHWGVYVFVTKSHHLTVVRAMNAEIDCKMVFSPITDTYAQTLAYWMEKTNNALKRLEIYQK